jgi:hypothetical protein
MGTQVREHPKAGILLENLIIATSPFGTLTLQRNPPFDP